MTLKKFLPVALMVAVVAAIYVIVVQYLKVSAIWVPFISWPLYFMAGAKPGRLHKEVIGLTGGMIFGYLTLSAMGPIGNIVGPTLGLPVTVFFVALIILLLELTDWFELAPAYFFAYAGYFAYVFGGFGGALATDFSNLLKIAWVSMPLYWVLLMVGLVLGIITAALRKKILEKGGVYGTAQETVFDKERQ